MTLWGPGKPLEPARSPFAAGTLLDLDFKPFWLHFESQKHGLGPLEPPLSYHLPPSNHFGDPSQDKLSYP